MVAGMAGLLAGAGHPLGARRLPSDLLLLPGRLLQGLLGRPALVRGERAPSALPRRGFAAAGPAERPPLLPLPRPGVPAHPHPRRLEGDVVRGVLRTRLGRRRRYAGPPGQHHPARRVRARMPFVAPPRRRRSRPDGGRAGAEGRLRLRQLPQPPAHGVGLDEPVRRGPGRSVRPAVLDGRDPRLENHLTAQVQTHEHDVLVIGAGGAGLRAAIEASTAKVSVGLVCQSLLGKPHTVMAEGGIAAGLSNVDERDSWKVHFADTMRGGQYVNNWRMAELHAREAPDRVRELEAWGAVFDRTADGRILQRNFGGHRYPRLAHVGDRTGLEMIRTLQDHGIHQGIEVHMEHTIVTLLKDGDRIAGAFGYDRERGRFKVFKAKALVLATGGIGRAYRITSNSWEYTGDGQSLAYQAGAELIDMEYVQFHPTGMIWPPSVMGILVTEGVRGEGGILCNKEGQRFMFADIPDDYKPQTADNPEEGWRYTQGDKNARRPPELLTRDHVSRCIINEVKAGRGTPHGGVFLDISWIKEKIPNAAEHIKKKLPSMYHQFKELAGGAIPEEPQAMRPAPATN